MRRTSKVYKNDIGARIVLKIVRSTGGPYDTIPNANVRRIKLTTPSGVEKVFVASFAQSPFGNGLGTDGVVEYVTTTEADLPESGPYKVQGYFEFSATDKRHTQPTIMYVGEIPAAP